MAAQTDAAPAAEPFDTRALGAYLSVALKGFAGPLRVAPFAFGQSNPTFKLTTPCQTLVLRKRPSGANLPASAHAVDREFRVLQALQDSGVPVPRVHCLCMDDGVIGTPFYIMDFVPGRIFHDPAMPSVHPQHRTACYASALQALVALHGVDPASLGLASFGVQGGANFYARQVRRLASVSRQQAAHAPEVPGLDELEQALQAQVPPGTSLYPQSPTALRTLQSTPPGATAAFALQMRLASSTETSKSTTWCSTPLSRVLWPSWTGSCPPLVRACGARLLPLPGHVPLHRTQPDARHSHRSTWAAHCPPALSTQATHSATWRIGAVRSTCPAQSKAAAS